MNDTVCGSSRINLHSTLPEQRMRPPTHGETGWPPVVLTAELRDGSCEVLTRQLSGIRSLSARLDIFGWSAGSTPSRRSVSRP